MPATTVVESELDRTINALPDRPRRSPRNPQDPIMPFRTELALTRDQEERLVRHCLQRLRDCEDETCRDDVMCGDQEQFHAALAAQYALGVKTQLPWMVRRALYALHFHNDFSDRLGQGGIFAESNLTASVAPRICMQVAGKLKRAFYGTDPWFSAGPVGAYDDELARTSSAFARFRAERCDLKSNYRESIDTACLMGEGVIKTIHFTDRTWYWKSGELLKTETGVPVFDSSGNYVWKEDRFIPEMTEIQEDPNLEPEMAPTGRQVLRRDNSVVLEPTYQWVQDRVRVADIKFQGGMAEVIRYTDFLCPLSAPSVDKADICFHLYEKGAMEVANWFLYGRHEYVENQENVVVDGQKAMHLIKEIASSARMYSGETDAQNPRTEHGEQDLKPAGSSGLIPVVEAWVRFDADEDGVQEEIVIMIDPTTELPLYYEYVGIATPDKRRPFTVQRVLPVHGRWYGMGIMEYLEPESAFLDLLVNRWNMTTSQSGSVKFWDPAATVEGLTDPNLKLNCGQTYRLREGADAARVLQLVEIYARDHCPSIVEMIQFFMQLMQLKTGVISVGDEAVSNLESTKLATGIRSLERSGSELFESWLQEAARGQSLALKKFIVVTIVHMNPRETFRVLEGNDSELLQISRDDVRDMDMDVNLLLAGDGAQEVIERFGAAMGVLVKYYTELPIEAQPGALDMTIQALRELKVRHPEKVVAPLGMPPTMAQGGQLVPFPEPAGAPGEELMDLPEAV